LAKYSPKEPPSLSYAR